MSHVLLKLLRINGSAWEWGENAAALGKVPGSTDAGVIAQDVEAVFPELVEERDGYKHVNYAGLVGVIVEAVRELDARVKKLEERP